MNEFLDFISKHAIEVVTLAIGVVSAFLNLLLVRINAKIKKELTGIDIDGDGIGDLDPKFESYLIKCQHCQKYTRLSDAEFYKEVNDEKESTTQG